MLKLAVAHRSFRFNLDKTSSAEVALIFRYKPTGNLNCLCLIAKKENPRSSSSYSLTCPYPNLQWSFWTTEFSKIPSSWPPILLVPSVLLKILFLSSQAKMLKRSRVHNHWPWKHCTKAAPYNKVFMVSKRFNNNDNKFSKGYLKEVDKEPL